VTSAALRRPPAAGLTARAANALAWLDANRLALYILVAAVAVPFYVVNVGRAPDFDVDSVLYTTAGQNVASHGALAWDGSPILVHPPLFFITVGLWLLAAGAAHSSLLSALHVASYADAPFCVGSAVLSASLVSCWTRRTGAGRVLLVLAAGLLVALDPFLVRFGRIVLLEPMTLCVALGAVRLAWGLRNRSTLLYVAGVGSLMGLSLLCKETAVFVIGGPLVAAVLRWRRVEVLRNLGAALVAAFVFCAFVWWSILEGTGGAFGAQLRVNVERLVGILQITGLNRSGVSPFKSLADTFLQYSAGYLVMLLGGIALIACVLTRRFDLRRDERGCQLIGFGLIGYVFLLYSVFFGQSNEQLTDYAVPASVLLALLAWEYMDAEPTGGKGGRRFVREHRRHWPAPVIAVGSAAALAIGLASWIGYIGVSNDTAVSQVVSFLDTDAPACAPVNSTGNPLLWADLDRRNPITAYFTGAAATKGGVHIFLLSPKDATFHFAPMSPHLADWIRSHGHEVFSASSHTFQSIQVWYVGHPHPRVPSATAPCADPIPAASTHASVGVFVGVLAASLAAVWAGFALLWWRPWRPWRLRRPRHRGPA
jgi:hypothetical protein